MRPLKEKQPQLRYHTENIKFLDIINVWLVVELLQFLYTFAKKLFESEAK